MALSPWWAFNTALGNSEGLLAAAVLWAIVAHLERPPPGGARAADRRRADAPGGVAVPGRLRRLDVAPRSRRPVRGARWRAPRSRCCGSARTSSAPAARSTPPRPPAASRARAAPSSRRSRSSRCSATPRRCSRSRRSPPRWSRRGSAGRTARLLAAGAAAWVAIVAVMTVAGYAGNPRYLVAAAAVGAALAGVGAVRAATRSPRSRLAGAPRRRRARHRGRRDRPALRAGSPRPSAPPSSSPRSSPSPLGDLRDQSSELSSRADASGAFDGALAAAGGRDALVRCSRIRTSNRARSLRRLAARPPAARPRRPPDAPRGRDPREVVLRPGPRAAGPARLPHPRHDAVLADRRRLRPRTPTRHLKGHPLYLSAPPPAVNDFDPDDSDMT